MVRRRLRRITHDNLTQHNLCWNHTSFLFLCCGSIIVQGIIYKDTVSFVPARLRPCVYPFRIHGAVLDFLTSVILKTLSKVYWGLKMTMQFLLSCTATQLFLVNEKKTKQVLCKELPFQRRKPCS